MTRTPPGRRAVLALLCLSAVSTITGCGPDSARTGTGSSAPATAPATSGAVPDLGAPFAEPAWTLDTGSEIWGTPVTDGTSVYVGNDDGVLYALDAADGSIRWQQRLGGAIRVRLALAGSTLYLVTDDGRAHAVRARDGHRLWRTDIHAKAGTRQPWDTYTSGAAIKNGRVYVGSVDGRLYALDAGTGRTVWTARTGGAIQASPAVDAGVVVVGSFDGSVHAFDTRRGKALWSERTGGEVTSTPVIHDGTVYVGSRGTFLTAYDLKSGDAGWGTNFGTSWVQSSPVIDGDEVFIGSSDLSTVRSMDLASGETGWESDLGGWPWSTPTVNAERVFAGTVLRTGEDLPHGTFSALDRATGAVEWTILTGPSLAWQPDGIKTHGVGGSPVLVPGGAEPGAGAEELVVFGALDGVVYALPA